MKKVRYFTILLLALLVTVGIIMFPNMYYAVFDRNIESSDPISDVHDFESIDGKLTPTQVYKLLTEGGAVIADTPLASNFDRADTLTRKSLTRLAESFMTENCFTEAISHFLKIDNIDIYYLTTYCGVVDSQPVTLTLMGAQGTVDDVQFTVTIDVATETVYDFSASSGITSGEYNYDEEAAKEVNLELASYWNIAYDDICDNICVEVIPSEFCLFSLIDTNNFYTEIIQEGYS
ncbi:MAG: hypothetical protein ACI4GZ_00155 [Ruminococcus sp.]